MATTVGTLIVQVIGDASRLAGTLGAAERTLERFGSRMFFLGSRMSAGVTLPIVALGATINRWGKEFDSAMTESLAIMDNVTAEQRDLMRERAFEIARDSKFSAAEIAKGYYDLASAGFPAKDVIEGIGTVARFAQAGLMDMSTAGEHLAGAANALGPELAGASDKAGAMARMADVLTRANNKALGTVQDFAAALSTRFAGAMKVNNMQLEDGVALLMAYAQNNIRGRDASMRAWMVLRDLQMATSRAGSAWKQYGISVFDAGGKMRPVADILQQFSKTMKGMNDLQKTEMFKNLRLPDRSRAALIQLLGMEDQIRQFQKDLKDNAGGEAARVAAEQAQAMAVKWAAAFHRMQEAGIRFYDAMKPILIEVFELVAQAGDKLVEWAKKFDTLDASTKKWVAGGIAFVAVLGPAISLMGSWTLGFSALGLGMSSVLKMFSSLGAFLMGTTTAQAKAVASTGLLSKAWTALGGVGSTIIRLLPRLAWQLTAVVAVFDLFRPALKYLLGDSIDLTKIWQTLGRAGDYLRVIFLAVWTELKAVHEVFSIVWKLAQSLILGFTKLAVASVHVGEGIKRAVTSGLFNEWDRFVKLIMFAPRVFSSLSQAALKMMGDLIGRIPVVGQMFVTGFNLAKTAAGELFGYVGAKVAQLIEAIGRLFAGLAGKIGEFFTRLFDHIRSQIVGTAQIIGRIAGKHLPDELPKQAKDTGSFLTEAARTNLSLPGGWLRMATLLNRFAENLGVIQTPQPGDSEFIGPVGMGNWEGPEWKDPMEQFMDEIRALFDADEFKDGLFPKAQEDANNLRRIQTAFEELMGRGKETWQATFEAFKQHRAEILASEGATLRLRDAYLQIRDEIEQIPELEELFKNDIALANMEAMSGRLTEFQKDFINLQMGMDSSTDFFKKHGAEIERMGMHYSQLDPVLMHLVNEYRRWQSEMAAFDLKVAQHIQSSNAFNEVANAHAEMLARMKDKEEEVAMFRLSEGDRVLRQMSKNYEQETLKFWKEVVERQRAVERTTGVHRELAEKEFLAFVEAGGRFLAAMKENDLQRLVFSLNVNEGIKRSFLRMTGESLSAYEEFVTDLVKMTKDAEREMSIWDTMASNLKTLSDVFDAEGKGWLTWFADMAASMALATKAGMDLAAAIQAIQRLMKDGGTFTDWFAAGAALLDAGVTGFRAIMQATNSASKGKNILGGAMAGMKIGANPILATMTGGLSIVGGALIGAIVGAIRGRGLRDVMRMVGKDWGTIIGEELAKEIQKTAKEDFGGNRQLAEMAHFADILEAAGGLSSKNFDTFQARLRDFFVFAETGLMDSANALAMYSDHFGTFADYVTSTGGNLANEFAEHIRTMSDLLERGVIDQTDVMSFLDKNFEKFAENMAKHGHVAGRGWQDVLNLIHQLDEVPAAVMEFFRGVATSGGEAWGKVIQGTTYKFDGLADKIKDAREELDELKAKLLETEDDEDKEEVNKDIEEATKKLNDLLAEQKMHAAGAREEMERLGLLTLTAFNAGLENGLTWSELMDQMSPALDALVNGFKDLGIESDNAAVKHLINMRNMFNANKPLFQGIDALKQGMITLSKLGALNQTTFDLIAQQGTSMFRRVQAEVAAMGGTHEDALRAMLPFLMEMQHAADEYGFELDAATAEMIAQARELGILKPKAKELPDIMETGFERVAQAIEDMTTKLLAALGVAQDLADEFRNMPTPQPPGGGAPPPPPGYRPEPDSPGHGAEPANTISPYTIEPADRGSVVNSISINIETQNVDEQFVRRKLVPMLERLGSGNVQQTRTRLRNGIGV